MLVWRSIPGDDVSYSDNVIHHHCFCFVLFFLAAAVIRTNCAVRTCVTCTSGRRSCNRRREHCLTNGGSLSDVAQNWNRSLSNTQSSATINRDAGQGRPFPLFHISYVAFFHFVWSLVLSRPRFRQSLVNTSAAHRHRNEYKPLLVADGAMMMEYHFYPSPLPLALDIDRKCGWRKHCNE